MATEIGRSLVTLHPEDIPLATPSQPRFLLGPKSVGRRALNQFRRSSITGDHESFLPRAAPVRMVQLMTIPGFPLWHVTLQGCMPVLVEG